MGKVNREGGFTFLELILVLSILTIITAIILPVSNRWIQTTSEKDAIQAFMASVYDIQAYSMAHKVYTQLKIDKDGSVYFTATPGKGEFKRVEFPDGMSVNDNSGMKAVEFTSNGDIIKTGSMLFDTSSGPIQIRFQFLRGRMIVYEQ